MEITQTTGIVTVLDILPGDAPAILTQEEANYRSGRRLFTQKLPVCDSDLFRQLEAESRKGDRIEATVVTEWGEESSRSYLAAYRLLTASATAGESIAAL